MPVPKGYKHRYKYLTKCPDCGTARVGHQDVDMEGEVFTYAICTKCQTQKDLDPQP